MEKLFEVEPDTSFLRDQMQADPALSCLALAAGIKLVNKNWGGV